MRIGLTYDLRSDYLKMGFSEEDTAEFDRESTVEGIENALRRLGHDTVRIGHHRALMEQLCKGERWDLVFNFCEGMYGIGREAQVPALLDAHRIPYVFSDPLVLALTLHKGMTKRVVRDAGVPTPEFLVVESMEDISPFAAAVSGAEMDVSAWASVPESLRCPSPDRPLFAKPVAEGTGKGITGKSIIRSRQNLLDVCASLLDRFKQPVLVEDYLPGREFTVGVVGTGAEAESVGVMEVILNEKAEKGVYSYTNKEFCDTLVEYRIPTDDEAKLSVATAIAAWRALGCRDGGRVDMRSDARGTPNFMEVNPLAGLHPEHSDLPIICNLQGYPYDKLIERIVASATKRIPAILAQPGPRQDPPSHPVPPPLDLARGRQGGNQVPSALSQGADLSVPSPSVGEGAARTVPSPSVGEGRARPTEPRRSGVGGPLVGTARAVVLHNDVPDDAPLDEKDNLFEAEAVAGALAQLGYSVEQVAFTLDFDGVATRIRSCNPRFVFNIVESVEGKGRLIHLATAMLDHLGVPYTGARTDAMYTTSNKIIGKLVMAGAGIPTAAWTTLADVRAGRLALDMPCIVKSVWEHASVGLDHTSIVRDRDLLEVEMLKRRGSLGGECFAEEFIHGREFNVAIIAGRSGPEVLPVGEIQFRDFEPGRPHMVSYAAKWEEGSFEYENTPRRFDIPKDDAMLIERLKKIALDCWRVFGLTGYARVDFRVDDNGNPFVLEVNVNPCISPDSGFTAMVSQAGYTYSEFVKRMIEDCLHGK